MVQFAYTAVDQQHATRRDVLEAATRSEALAHLQKNGLFTLELREVGGYRFSQTKRVSTSTLNRFYGLLADQLEVGVPLLKAIEVIGAQESHPAMQLVVHDLEMRVTSGAALSQALAAHPGVFSKLDVSVIHAGEEGGFLETALKRLAEVREWQAQLQGSVLSALAYPALLLAVSMLLIPGILLFLVPQFEPLFDSLRQANRMPWMTTLLLQSSHALREYGWLLAGGLIGLIVAAWGLVPPSTRKAWFDRLILKVPLVGPLMRDLALVRTTRIFGTLLQNRIPLLRSLQIVQEVAGNQVLAQVCQDAQGAVSSGKTLLEPFSKSSFIPPELLAMIGVGEQSNTLDEVFLKISDQLESKSQKRLTVAVKLIEPLMLLILAIFVGAIALALLLPIFEGQGLV